MHDMYPICACGHEYDFHRNDGGEDYCTICACVRYVDADYEKRLGTQLHCPYCSFGCVVAEAAQHLVQSHGDELRLATDRLRDARSGRARR